MTGEIPSPSSTFQGCKFCTRCSYADDKCREEVPPWVEQSAGHFVACFKVNERI